MEAAQSEKIDLLAKALCRVQKELKPVEKTRTAKIKTRTGADYSYKYADLETVVMSCRDVLNNNDFAVSQLTNPARDGVELITTLMHGSGQWLRGVLFLPAEMDAQKFGAALTYARRYSLCAITGIVADEDNDAGGTTGKQPGKTPKDTGKKSPPTTTRACPKCEGEAILQTVLKEGKNKGKKFWSCKDKDDCGYFGWYKEEKPENKPSEPGSKPPEGLEPEPDPDRFAKEDLLTALTLQHFGASQKNKAVWLAQYGKTGTVAGLDADGINLALDAIKKLVDK